MRIAVAFLLLALALGGCTGDAAPPWTVGERWHYELRHAPSGMTSSVELGVVAVGDGALVGATSSTDLELPLIVHLPPMGEIAADGSFEMHDVRFHPMTWPAREGAMWTTSWMHGERLDARVQAIEDDVAEVVMQGEGVEVWLRYDLVGRHIVAMDVPGYAHLRLTAQEYDRHGWFVVPYDQDLVFYHGRTQGGLAYPDGGVAGPTGTIEVDDHDAVVMALIMRDRGVEGMTPPGIYDLKVAAPDGTRFDATFAATEIDDYAIALHTHDGPQGTWSLQALAAGHGYALLEGIGHDQVEVRLPERCARSGAHPLFPPC